jgi:hypothetical protein
LLVAAALGQESASLPGLPGEPWGGGRSRPEVPTGLVRAGIFRLLGLYFVGQRTLLGVVGFSIVGLVSGWLAGQFMALVRLLPGPSPI